ncbi:cobyrinic acid a,c-diamide synthase [Rhodoblastus acidophilus]|uniref:cobyrinate a,c-diamide synthase n=1 Tax=Rhodoblastus acidophilus TaxID=1074 RepID=UPI0018B05D5B|nr:cobyrinate a,c-diamide synthase [Rhodoblastus acidophilus]MCW2274636.1 cobyrinic acid a,c-diamide synthase [Rhodoblastus acidophilus]
MTARIVVSGAGSGSGKTLLTAGLIGALRRRGFRVQPFKCGPDYIDPGWLSAAAGRPCRNLDAWMLGVSGIRDSFARACADADIAVIEGVMGLFDGAGFDSDEGSTAAIAAALGAPVLLILDISGAARSAAALALGFARFDETKPVAALALNFAGSEGHAKGCAAAIAQKTGLPTLGWMPRKNTLTIPERHLGLDLAALNEGREATLAAVAEAVAQNFDLDALLALARAAPALPTQSFSTQSAASDGPILALASDPAFSFYYQDDIDILAAAGARVVRFSPVGGDTLPEGTAGVFLGGGYPELFAREIAANTRLWRDLRALHEKGAPILAECGGFMALTEALIDLDGVRHPMAGLVPGAVKMTQRLASLGYRRATALVDTPLLRAGEDLRGHEFHYSVWEREGAPPSPAWRLQGSRDGSPVALAGHAERGLLASYVHIPLAQRLELAARFVEQMRAFASPHENL